MPGLIRISIKFLYRGDGSSNKTRHGEVLLGLVLELTTGVLYGLVHHEESVITFLGKKWAKKGANLTCNLAPDRGYASLTPQWVRCYFGLFCYPK